MVSKHYSIIIVGSGPAALGVAEVLKENQTILHHTLILEKGRAVDERSCASKEGKKCVSCSPCNVVCGLGGAGPYTDGKICFYPQSLGKLIQKREDNENGNNDDRLDEIIGTYLEKCKGVWNKYGVTDLKEIEENDKMSALQTKALKHDIDYITYPVLHIGSDGATKAIKGYIDELTLKGVSIELNANVKTIKKSDGFFEVFYKKTNDGGTELEKVTSDFVVLALGRAMAMQEADNVKELLKDFMLKFKPNNLEIGCRVEVPYQIMEEITKITFDPKFKIVTPTYQDSVRTFCTCPRGKVVREGDLVNGHVDRKRLTKSTNFAMIVSYSLGDMELEDAMHYGSTIAKLANACGKGKPIIQRLGDLRRGMSSTLESIKKSHVKNTLRLKRQVEPGDIASFYPRRIVVDILEGLETLDEVIKGVNGDQTLLYAPEVKPSCLIELEEGVRTKVENLYVCGDFSGYTRGIAQAMSMGMMVGEDILGKANRLQLRFV